MARIAVGHTVGLRSETGRFLSQVEEGGHAALVEMTNLIAQMAEGFAPRRSGRLAGSIRGLIRGNTGLAVADAPWAQVQEKGGRPHVIAKRAPDNEAGGILANPEQGFFSARAVNHPGNPAVRFLTRAGQQVAALSPAIMKRNMPG